jgi:hypothetical protein
MLDRYRAIVRIRGARSVPARECAVARARSDDLSRFGIIATRHRDGGGSSRPERGLRGLRVHPDPTWAAHTRAAWPPAFAPWNIPRLPTSPIVIAVDSLRIASSTPSAVTGMTRGRGRLTSTQLSQPAVAEGRFRSDPSTAQGRPGSTRTRAGRPRATRATAGLAHALRRVLDLPVDFLGTRIDFLGDVLIGFQRGLIHGILDGALADDQQSSLAHVDEVPQLLDV